MDGKKGNSQRAPFVFTNEDFKIFEGYSFALFIDVVSKQAAKLRPERRGFFETEQACKQEIDEDDQ